MHRIIKTDVHLYIILITDSKKTMDDDAHK